MKWTVSSFTSEHLQQSLQHCNESISYDESTGYGGRSSATGNGHLTQHRDRCGRWASTHPPQEHTDFQVYGIPLQMCMWFWVTRQEHKQQWLLCRIGRRVKTPYLHVLTNMQARQGRFFNAPRRTHEFVKEFFSLFTKKQTIIFGLYYKPHYICKQESEKKR